MYGGHASASATAESPVPIALPHDVGTGIIQRCEAPGKAFGSSKQPAIHKPDKLSTPDQVSIIRSPATAEMNVLCHRDGALNMKSSHRRRVESSRTESLSRTKFSGNLCIFSLFFVSVQ